MSLLTTQSWEQIVQEEFRKLRDSRKLISDIDYEEGIIAMVPKMDCPNGHRGVYVGFELYGGKPFISVDANYCPQCDQLWKVREVRPAIITTPPGAFLPALRKRVSRLDVTNGLDREKPCPSCGAPTFTLTERAGIINTQLVRWTVCSDSAHCYWPGQFEYVN